MISVTIAFGVAKWGTIVERLAPEVYQVEFIDDEGRTYASLGLRVDRLLQLHHRPADRAA
jgi:hypothetical protein